jgi:hypothetical protein
VVRHSGSISDPLALTAHMVSRTSRPKTAKKPVQDHANRQSRWSMLGHIQHTLGSSPGNRNTPLSRFPELSAPGWCPNGSTRYGRLGARRRVTLAPAGRCRPLGSAWGVDCGGADASHKWMG